MERAAADVRKAMQALADAPPLDKKEAANEMLHLFAKYNEIAEKEIDAAISFCLEQVQYQAVSFSRAHAKYALAAERRD